MRLIRTSSALVLGLLVAAVAGADTLLVAKSHTDPFSMMGRNQPAKDLQIETWVGADGVARSDGETTIIVRTAEKKMYVVNHGAKSYSVIDLPVDFKKLLPAEMAPMAEQMMGMMKMNATVTPTDERRQINGWNARKYLIAVTSAMGMNMNIESWTTKDLDVDVAALHELRASASSLQPGGDWARMLSEVEGYPVLQESTMTMRGMSVKSREELVSAETKAAPAGVYEPPAGYQQKAFDAMGAMQQRSN
jgi:uncharacterized protein DUF4412